MRRRGRIFAVLFIASGTAFLGLLTGGEHLPVRAAGDPMAGYWPAPMPTYPGSAPRPIVGDQTVGGSAMKLAYFTTPDIPARVGDFYAEEWRKAGLYVTEDITPKGGSVSAYDAVEGVMRQIVILARAGQTMVFPALVTEPVRVMEPATVPPEIPVYPGATGVLVTTARDPIARSQVVAYMDEGPIEANLTFYKGEMQRLGWANETKAETHKDVGDDARILVYTRDGAECTVNFLKIDDTHTRVHVTLVRQ
ncbi:MAG TPA: hypothetical protein VGQ83_27200 [Polyangia bacterium]|jgi:hypothetical protein